MPAQKRFVYVLKNADASSHFYVGLTSNVVARMADHNAGRCPHTAAAGLGILVRSASRKGADSDVLRVESLTQPRFPIPFRCRAAAVEVDSCQPGFQVRVKRQVATLTAALRR